MCVQESHTLANRQLRCGRGHAAQEVIHCYNHPLPLPHVPGTWQNEEDREHRPHHHSKLVWWTNRASQKCTKTGSGGGRVKETNRQASQGCYHPAREPRGLAYGLALALIPRRKEPARRALSLTGCRLEVDCSPDIWGGTAVVDMALGTEKDQGDGSEAQLLWVSLLELR